MAEHDGSVSHQTVPLNDSSDVHAPLHGYVICCTSVPDEKRTQLAEYAKQMGAAHTYDLTLDVTHLIVGEYDTPKFRYVAQKRLDVLPMTIGWIEAVRELWINDQEIDLPLLEQQHRMPTFKSLRFSMTGCDDPTERLEIAAQVKANGATYEGDLTKSITHLISFRTEGAKYKAAKCWKLKIVSIEWVRDSLERGMILDERLYDPALPPLERGKDAWDKTAPKRRISLGKRSREETNTSFDGGKRKLRRTASTKLSTQNEQIWGDIVGGGAGGNVAQVNRSGQWGTNDEESVKPHSHTANTAVQIPNPSILSTIENQRSVDGIFSGCRFYTHGFPPKRSQILHEHLTSNGAEVVETVEALVAESVGFQPNRLFRMLPHDLPISEFPILPDSQLPIETITFWWLERCLHQKKFLDPNNHVIGRPFPVFPIEGFSGVTISSSAFAGIDLLHFQRAVELLGATYSEDFMPNSSVLVTKYMAGLRKDKYDHAQEWKVPILNADWIWDSISAGTKLPTSKYRCRSQKRSDSLPNTAGSKPATRHRAGSEITKVTPKISNHTSKSIMKPPPVNSRLDSTAFSTEGDSSVKVSTKPPHNIIMDDTAFSTEDVNEEPTERPMKPSRKSIPDNTAFSIDDPTEAPIPNAPEEESIPSEIAPKEECHTQGSPSMPERCLAGSEDVSQDLGYKAKPLTEIDGNSPTRTVSTAPEPSDHFSAGQEEGLTSAISTLLAKAKTAPIHSAPEPRKRSRIIGRVPSNLSTGSTRSRDTSVDSTATHGNPVEYPPYNTNSTPNDRIQMLLNGDKPTEAVDSQPPATQLQYEDTESNEAREILMAKMRGQKVERKGIKEKTVTLGDYTEQPRTTRRTAGTRNLR
ncbi:related to S-M checkpoint control protein Rad4p [Rhynchosporium secalis]|uniref:Related to S-M checkpoint control protein Rad4p n=1 Tax=Rhynchosporium secalis TaxID=38038 RepID=A0A1E1LVZ5_RHYSE|nr:related to S-M checkpoint control protein Rad4p [Rhynchosporium secalis]